MIRFPVKSARQSSLAGIAFFLLAGGSVMRADTYTVTNTNGSGPGSLDQAIRDSNARTGQDMIVFSIPGPGVRLIDLSQTVLPEITDSLILDGYTQPGAHPNTLSVGNDAVILIHLDGGVITGRNGLIVSAPNCLIRGLAITRFLSAPDSAPSLPPVGGNGIHSRGSSNVIEGNFLGLDPDGVTVRGNFLGVRVDAGLATIGGAHPAARNVISGNTEHGVAIYSPARAIITGNYIGTDASGTRAAGNFLLGVALGASDVVVGGTASGAGNLISGNGAGISLGLSLGFRITAPADRAIIQGNLIGTTADGIGALGNGSTGISFSRSSNSIAGGLEPGAGNVIAFNDRGVTVFGTGNSILSNSIYAHNGRGIYLGNAEANNGQTFPVITSHTFSNGAVTVRGTLRSTPSTRFSIQIFADSQSLTSSEQTYVGSANVTTNSSGTGNFSATFPFSDENVIFNATATDPDGNTSEFYRNPVFLQNLSARAHIGTGDDALIGGLMMRFGQMLIRGIGPSLEPLGLTDALADPTLTFQDGTGAQMFNDDWRDNDTQATQIAASGLAPTAEAESAMMPFSATGGPFIFRSRPGFTPYTAILRGKRETTGVGLVEAYDLASINPGFSPLLANISARAFVAKDDNVIIAGFIMGGGNASRRIVVRAIGSSLKAAGIANPLSDPVLELHDSNGSALNSNDNWEDTQKDDLQTVELAPTDAMESAILTRLGPGAYTAVVRGKDNETGIALVEVYRLP
jgi:hypothetical protein